jgi:hypothetical protein
MKTCFIMVMALTLTALSASAAEQGGKTTSSKSVKAKQQIAVSKQKPEQVVLTGSYIKREVRRRGMITDGPYNVTVIDSDMIRNSGASDLHQLLVRRGLSR